uniref:Nudix hydrolase domain-containing protein n=1 Tax=Leersia perrieri TaxID=77586 RepID=A0A0D9VDZ3_9ORYZ
MPRRRLATTYSGRIAAATTSPAGPSLTVTVSPPPTSSPPHDPRGYPLPRRHLVCAAARILRSGDSPSPLLDLADYLRSHSLTLTAAEASEVVKSLSPDPPLALAFFRFAAESLPGFRHDAFSYNRVLALLFRTRAGPSEAMRLVAEMERDGVVGNVSTVNLLVGMGGGGVEVERCLELAGRWGVRLSGYTYKCIVQAHLRSREVSKGLKVYEEMRRKGYKLDIFAYNMLLDALAKAGMVDQAFQVFEDMKQKHCVPDAYTYTILIRMSGKAGRTSKFLSFFDEMISKGCVLNLIAFNTIIEALGKNKMVGKSLCKSGHASEAHIVFCRMWNSHEKGDRDAFVSMLEVLCNAQKTLEAIDLLHMMPEKGIATDVSMYNMVFSALGKLKQVSFISNLFDKMKANGIVPDVFTYNIMISSYGRVGLVDKASELFERMETTSCKPDVITYNSLINCLGKNGDLDEAHMLFKEMQEKGYDPDVFTYSILIECFGKSNKVEMACSLFDEMISEGCTPNIVTYNILLDCLERRGKTEEAHKLYENMKQQGLIPDSITYSILERLESRSQRTVRIRSVFRQPCLKLSIFSGSKTNNKGTNAAISDAPLLGTIDVLDAFEDDYGGIVVNPTSLPNTSNAFASSLQSSLSYWSNQGKRGVWLKIHEDQADLVPIAIKAGFVYHHAEPGYVMLTFWLPDGPPGLPSTSLHQIGVGAFVMNDKNEVLVVKEGKCPPHCSGIWKIPTGFIDKFEDLFSGAIREVREETGIESCFGDVVAFRHAHQVTFDKSDILFICTLKPLSFDISIDESEIEAARWMPVEEFLSQPFHQEDQMSRAIIDICIAAHQKCYTGLTAHQVMSKLDNRVTYLYTGYNREATGCVPEI